MEIEMEGKPTEVNEEEQEEDELTQKRIFVGGLGEKVTEDDLRKTFSSLGTVEDVEFVKSSGRSFAYIEFKPSSAKSLSKLFSSYNGCVWKGGRLRLEKAKEHYMVRLQREWDEEADVAHKTNDEVVVKESNPLPKSKALTLEKKQIQIFFPRLRKVKSVPYSGTGKHKYSFQRIEVPPLPIHFCDCEEHCASSEIAKAKQLSDFQDKAGKVNEEELDMMRSVMDKLFKREDNIVTDCTDVMMPTEQGSSNHSIDDVPPHEPDADEDNDDDDNLVINIANGGNFELGLMENVNQESVLGKRQRPSFGLTQNKINAQTEKNNDPFNPSDTSSKKKPTSLPTDRSGARNEFASSMPQNKKNQEIQPKNSKDRPDQKLAAVRERQKSSWKALGETTNNAFSISQILLEASMKQNVPTSSGLGTNNKRKKPRKQDPSAGHMHNEIPEDKISADGAPIEETTASEPVELMKEDISQDMVITDDPSVAIQSETSMKESQSTGEDENQTVIGLDSKGKKPKVICESTEPVELMKEVEPTEQKAGDNKKVSWIQKSSWTKLVGEMDNSSFSISNILPDIAFKRENLPDRNTTSTVNPFDNKEQNESKLRKGEGASSKNQEVSGVLTEIAEKKSENEELDNKPGKKISPLNHKSLIDTDFGEECSFMRTKESEKEWMKTRASLRASLKKKKSNDKSNEK